MGGPRHVTKRLYTQLAKVPTVSTSHLPKFPPKEAIYSDSPSAKPFSPEIWAQLQPPPPSALSAFVHRIGMNNVLGADLETVQLACTHSSFVPFHKHYHPQQAVVSNAQLAHTGNALLGMFGAEHVHATYPYLPTRVLKAAVTSFVGPASCAAVANEMGATPLLRWHRTVRYPPTSLNTKLTVFFLLFVAENADSPSRAPSRRARVNPPRPHSPGLPKPLPPLRPPIRPLLPPQPPSRLAASNQVHRPEEGAAVVDGQV